MVHGAMEILAERFKVQSEVAVGAANPAADGWCRPGWFVIIVPVTVATGPALPRIVTLSVEVALMRAKDDAACNNPDVSTV